MMKNHIVLIAFLLVFSMILCSCAKKKGSDDSLSYEEKDSAVSHSMNAAKETNAIKKYSADFLLEITDKSSGNLIVFAQGSFDADKTDKLKMSGSMVQTVNAIPASLYMAYKDGKYYVKSGEETSITEFSEAIFLNQFLCADAIIVTDVTSINKKSNGSGGTVYAFSAKCDDIAAKLKLLIDTDVFYYAGVKKMRLDTLGVENLTGEYIVNDKTGLLKSRTIEFTEYVYDTAPYYPNSVVDDEEMKRCLNVKIKITYKKLDGSSNVVFPDFVK